MSQTLVQCGHEALPQGAWEESHGAFEDALRQARVSTGSSASGPCSSDGRYRLENRFRHLLATRD